MKYKAEELKQLQDMLKSILFEIDKICRKHNIKYFAVAGTLLGAVRHNDIIPWDDDIDIGMLREDYEKFVKVTKEELPEDLFVLDFESYKSVPIYYAKVCKKGTTFTEKEVARLKYPHCIFVDILVCDRYPVDQKKREKQMKKVRFQYELFKSKTLWSVSATSNKKKRIIGNILRPLLHIALFIVPKKAIYKKLIKVSTKYQDLGEHCYFGYKGKVAYPYEFLMPLSKLKFDTVTIPVPKDSKELLTRAFGDYMTPPPVEKRISHSPLKFSLTDEK